MNSCYFRISGAVCLVMAALALAACAEQPVRMSPAPEIPYLVVAGETVTLTKELPGRVSAFTVSEVRPQVGGIIRERLFEEGADVTEGQVLYQIDPVLYQAAYNNARANLAKVLANEDAARLLAERYGNLVRTRAVSRQEYDDAVAAYGGAKAEIEAAREALETARINLGYTRITAPVSGRIGRSFVTPGALVTQNQESPLATVQRISPVYVDVVQPSAELLRLRRDLARGRLLPAGENSARVRLYLEDGTPYVRGASENADQWIEGELLFSDITVERSTGVVSIRARFDNPEGILLPGMYVRAVLEEGVLENALLVPQKSVGRDASNRPRVFVLTREDPAAKEQPGSGGRELGEGEFYVTARTVRIERDVHNRWLVSDGLAPGDRLVVEGAQHVRPGMVVSGAELMPSLPLAATDAAGAAETRGR